MNQHAPSRAETYEHYLSPGIAHPWTRVLLESAAPRSCERVLDVACGTGSVARHVAPIVGAQGRVVALDVNADNLAFGRTLPAPEGATIEWRQGDARSLDLPDGAFDLVVCQQGVQYFPDRAASVREMRRVLAAHGRVVISAWRSLDLHPLYEALLTATSRHLGVPASSVGLSFSLPDAAELGAVLKAGGFRQIEVVPRSLDAHLPEPARFARLTVVSAATSVPAFARLDAAAQSALVDAVVEETRRITMQYSDQGRLTFTMSSHVATARVS